MGDEEILQKLSNRVYFYYHRSCQVNFIKRYDRFVETKKPEGDWHIIRQFHKKTFDAFHEILEYEMLK